MQVSRGAMNENNYKKILLVGLVSAIALLTAACGSSTTAAVSPPPPPTVAVIDTKAQDVPIYAEFAAQTFARDMVEVRGRVDGYVDQRICQVGSNVRAGEPLYILDTRPYEAEVGKARADVAQSE